MAEESAEAVVRRLWERIQARDWAGVGALLSDDFELEWPQSGERIRGRENFLAVNRNYPGEWSIQLQRVLGGRDQAVSVVKVSFPDRVDTGISFCECSAGRIHGIVEYWPDPFPADPGRAQWVEPS